jgi:lambda family phage minor tail protein L
MTVPVSALQEIAPGAVIELFELELNVAQHGVAETYRFHAGTNLKSNGSLVWNANSYQRIPVEAEGFEYSGNGQLPRPKVRVSNILGTITALLQTLPNGLEGAKVTRIRTLARYIDAVNFPGDTNPYGTPDPTAEFPREIYYIDRKTIETRDVVEFELGATFDLAGVRAPKRQCISSFCQWAYKSAECGYTPVASFSGTYDRKALTATYTRSGTTITVTSTAHGIAAGDRVYLDFTSGTAADGFYTVATAATNTFTVASGTSGTTSGNVTIAWLKVTATAHGLTVGACVHLDFTSGTATDGPYVLATASANSFTMEITSGATTSGNVTGTQWYDGTDSPTTSSSSDTCGKRLSSCQARFGTTSGLPFGSFPGIGTYLT